MIVYYCRTALLSLDGGASSCQWEPGTAHKSAPTLKWHYLGADVLPADEAALFRVTLGNTVNYYQAGTNAKDRTGWKNSDNGCVRTLPPLCCAPDGVCVCAATAGPCWCSGAHAHTATKNNPHRHLICLLRRYVPANMQFGLDPYSLHNGILVEINGAISNDPLNQMYVERGYFVL